MPLVGKYEALGAEESDVDNINGEKGRIGRKMKHGVYEQLSLGEADLDVDVDEDWNSLRSSDPSEDEDSDQTQRRYTHFFEVFTRRHSLSNFAVSTFPLFGPSYCRSLLHLPGDNSSIMGTLSTHNDS